jgi:arylsulfatase A-like enzyme
MSPTESSPDVIVFMTDQHRFDHVGFGGNTIVSTPHLDALAARSVIFDRAYVANPICMPNRSTILTGLLPSVHGTRFNGISLDPSHWTFVRTLRAAGYRTVLAGKLHVQNMGVNAELIPLLTETSTEPDGLRPPHDAGWDTWELASRYNDETADHVVPPDFYGFDHVELTVGHGDHPGGHYRRWLRAQGIDPESTQGREHALSAFAGWDQIWKPNRPEELYPTTYVADRAIDAITSTPAQQPLLLQCSFPDPHHPFNAPGRYYDMYAPADVTLPATFTDPHVTSMPHIQNMVNCRGRQFFPVAAWAPNEDQMRAALAAQYGAITMIDDAIGRVLRALETAGRSNAVIVFTSDHGDMMGDHGLMLKAALHYSGCVRVPLTIAAPSAIPHRCQSLVSHLDLGTTILDLVGRPTWVGQQGRSLAAAMSGDDGKVRQAVLIEEDQIFDLARTGQPLRMRTVITDEFRYTRYASTTRGELFDLINDPEEMHNLFNEQAPSSLQHLAQEQLVGELIDAGTQARRPNYLA